MTPSIPLHRQDVPAAWLGRDQRTRTDWIVELGAEHIAELEGALSRVKQAGIPTAKLTRADFPLPTLAAHVASWRQTLLDGRGFLLVRGLPVERYSDEDAGTLFWAIGHHLGQPIVQNARGELLGHVSDTGDKARHALVRKYQTADDIAFHADGADVVGLLCLRAAKRGGASRIVSSIAVFNEIVARRPDLAPLLFERWPIDRRDEQPDGQAPYWSLPICRVDGDRLHCFFHSDYVHSSQRHADAPKFTDDQTTLLDLYERIAGSEDFYMDMDFRPGDMQFLSNRVTLHARTSYEDHEDPARKRHLLRLWLVFG